MKNTIMIEQGGLKVILRPTNDGWLVSVLFADELIEQYTDTKVGDPTMYALNLVSTFSLIMRTSVEVPDLNEINYA